MGPPVDKQTSRKVPKTKARKPKAQREEGGEPTRGRTVEKVDLGGNEYVGEVRLTKLDVPTFEGSAKYTWSKAPGSSYEGTFGASSINGTGKFVWPDGSSYEGEFVKGMRHGQGTFVWKDGKTTYMGQWENGQRHGLGRLDYAGGGQYFEGEWVHGMKHGKGKQVWAGGATMEGIWVDGIIQGEGTMIWNPDEDAGENAVPECYSGEWSDGKPHGRGTHTWLAEPVKLEKMKHHAGPQQNNRYVGDWKEGTRHGSGTFYYANGSTFDGSWCNNYKHGAGIFTYEDGATFKAIFDNNILTEPAGVMRPSTGKAVLNIGGEDNPVRKCITLVDLGVGSESGSARESSFRESFNMLLRYFGELKHLYFRYRSMEVTPTQDPFMLTTLQLWILCRDLDCITPTLSLAEINRAITTGERFLTEAVPDGLGSRRALVGTIPAAGSVSSEAADGRPRKLSSERSQEKTPTSPDRPKPTRPTKDPPQGDPPPHKKLNLTQAKTQGGRSKDKAKVSPTGSGKDSPVRKVSKDEEEARTVQRDLRDPAAQRDLLRADSRGEEEEETATDEYLRMGVNIHAHDRCLLVRHFLELIVRLGVARFPHLSPLDAQLNELLQSHVLRLQPNSVSLETFHFWAQPGLRAVFEQHWGALYELFESRSVGRSFESAVVSEHGRQAGTNGRRDVTVRIKDVLQILEERGLLTEEPWDLPPAHQPLFKADVGMQDSDASSEVRNIVEEMGEGLAGLGQTLLGEEDNVFADMGLGSEFTSTDLGGLDGFGGQGSALDSMRIAPPTMPNAASKEPPASESASGGPSRTLGETPAQFSEMLEIGEVEKVVGEKEIEVSLPTTKVPEPQWVMRNDLRVNRKEVLEIITEVLSPWQRSSIRATTRREELPSTSHVSLLEYMETELIFFEFLRLLWRISELRTSDSRPVELGQSNSKLSGAQRLEGYLVLAFLPGNYAPPPKPPPPIATPVIDEVASVVSPTSPGEKSGGEEHAGVGEPAVAAEEGAPVEADIPKAKEIRVPPSWERRLDPAEVYADAPSVVERELWTGFTGKELPAAPRAFPRSRLQAQERQHRASTQARGAASPTNGRTSRADRASP